MRIVLVAAALAAVSLAGCGKKEESGKPSVTVTPGGYTARSKDGTVSVVTAAAAAAANAKVPAFAPLYPGARVESVMDGIGNDKAHGGTVVYKIDASPEKVVDFYKDKATAGGFKTEMDSNMGAAHMFAAKDEASGEAVQVIASASGDGSSVQVIWATKGK